MPLIIGTNEHEAALFRWMSSPLMPITPQAIKAMFAEIAAEQPGLQLPSEAEIGATYRARGKARGMGVARDLGVPDALDLVRRGARHRRAGIRVPVRLGHPDAGLLRLGAAHATELPYVWGNLLAGPKDPTFKLGGLKTGRGVSERMRARWRNFAGRRTDRVGR